MGLHLRQQLIRERAFVKTVRPVFRDHPERLAIFRIGHLVTGPVEAAIRFQQKFARRLGEVQQLFRPGHAQGRLVPDLEAAFRQPDRRLHNIGHRQLAEFRLRLAEPAHRSGNGDRAMTAFVLAAFHPDDIGVVGIHGGIEVVTRRHRRHAEEIDGFCLPGSGVVHDHEATGADAGIKRLHRTHDIGGRDRRIDGIAARLEDVQRRPAGVGIAACGRAGFRHALLPCHGGRFLLGHVTL